MNRMALIIVLFLVIVPFTNAQDLENNSQKETKNITYMDIMLLGAGLYNESVISEHFSAKFGCNFVCFGKAYTAFSLPIMCNYFSSNTSGFEAGIGAGVSFTSSTISIGGSVSNPKSNTMIFPALSLGYRYHNRQKDKFYRVGFEIPANFSFLLHFSFGL